MAWGVPETAPETARRDRADKRRKGSRDMSVIAVLPLLAGLEVPEPA